jgi:hypothetical protein
MGLIVQRACAKTASGRQPVKHSLQRSCIGIIPGVDLFNRYPGIVVISRAETAVLFEEYHPGLLLKAAKSRWR